MNRLIHKAGWKSLLIHFFLDVGHILFGLQMVTTSTNQPQCSRRRRIEIQKASKITESDCDLWLQQQNTVSALFARDVVKLGKYGSVFYKGN